MANDIKINFSDPNRLPVSYITLAERERNTDLSIELLGLSSNQYSRAAQQNLLKLLENFAGPEAPERPTAGQLWFNNTNRVLYVARQTTPTSYMWDAVGGIVHSSTAPTNQEKIWFDTTEQILKVHNGTQFVDVVENYLRKTGGTITGNLSVEETTTISGNVQGNTFNNVGVVQIDSANASLSINPNISVGSSTSNIVINTSNALTINSEGSAVVTIGLPTTSSDVFRLISSTNVLLSVNKTNVSFLTNVNMNNQKITNVPLPSSPSSLVPGSLINALQQTAGQYVLSTGDIMTGSLRVKRNLTFDTTGGTPVIDPNVNLLSPIRLTNSQGGTLQLQRSSTVPSTNYFEMVHNNGIADDVFLTVETVGKALNVHGRRLAGVATSSVPSALANKQVAENLLTAERSIISDFSKLNVRWRVTFDASTGTILNSAGQGVTVSKVTNGERNYFNVTMVPPALAYRSMCYVVTAATKIPPTNETSTITNTIRDLKYNVSAYQSGRSSITVSIDRLQKQTNTNWMVSDVDNQYRHDQIFLSGVEITIVVFY